MSTKKSIAMEWRGGGKNKHKGKALMRGNMRLDNFVWVDKKEGKALLQRMSVRRGRKIQAGAGGEDATDLCQGSRVK